MLSEIKMFFSSTNKAQGIVKIFKLTSIHALAIYQTQGKLHYS